MITYCEWAQQIENKKQIVHRFEQPDSANTCGYHGTSLSTLEYAVEHGVFPGGKVWADRDTFGNPQKPGVYFYFFPEPKCFPGHPLSHTFNVDIRSPEEGAGDYAKQHSVSHQIGNLLDLPKSPGAQKAGREELSFGGGRDIWYWYQSLDFDSMKGHVSDDLIKQIKEKGFDEASLRRKIKRLEQQHSGFLLGISKNVINDFEISNGDPDHGDLKISVPNGLPITYLSKIEPLGDREYDLLEQWQQEVDNNS